MIVFFIPPTSILVLRKQEPGNSWRSRYPKLSLHFFHSAGWGTVGRAYCRLKNYKFEVKLILRARDASIEGVEADREQPSRHRL